MTPAPKPQDGHDHPNNPLRAQLESATTEMPTSVAGEQAADNDEPQILNASAAD